jgi:phosphoglycerate dehydrogenase-like enzyme
VAAPRIAVAPDDVGPLLAHAVDAVEEGGGLVVDAAEAQALVWLDPRNPKRLNRLLRDAPGVTWVQLPWAGIEPYLGVLDTERTWTCGKGVYAEEVAEHALALLLAGLRGIVAYARATSWSAPRGHNLLGARVVIVGGGGITESLLRLLGPFGAEVTVVRRRPTPMEGAAKVVGADALDAALTGADAVVLALALTPETRGLVDERRLRLLAPHAWLVNVARGGHVVTDDLVAVLGEGAIGGAALDVTDPEPLPADHPLWSLPNCIVTPHVGNTPEMAVPVLRRRITENVRRFAAGQPLVGLVDVDLGY